MNIKNFDFIPTFTSVEFKDTLRFRFRDRIIKINTMVMVSISMSIIIMGATIIGKVERAGFVNLFGIELPMYLAEIKIKFILIFRVFLFFY